jgi:hypothetical protein
MTIAFTYQRGKNEGEYLREVNPEYVKMKKEMQGKIEQANK